MASDTAARTSVASRILAPESSVVRIAELSTGYKLVAFLVAYAAYWVTGLYLDSPDLAAWRLVGSAVFIFAVLLWGGPVGLLIFGITLPGTYAVVVHFRHLEFVGGLAGPFYALAVLALLGLLRSYILRLHRARLEIRTLEGIIPICAACKKVRDDEGFWARVEDYVAKRTPAQFSHGLCPDCHQAAIRAMP